MPLPQLPGIIIGLPCCHRCGSVPAPRTRSHLLFGRRWYCTPCNFIAGDTEEAIARDMGLELTRAAGNGLVDLGDWRDVQAWLLARHWSRSAIDALGEIALEQARRRLQDAARHRSLMGLILRGAEAVAVFGAAATWGVACILWSPGARADEIAAALGTPVVSGWSWAEILPLAGATLLLAAAVALALYGRPRVSHGLLADEDWDVRG